MSRAAQLVMAAILSCAIQLLVVLHGCWMASPDPSEGWVFYTDGSAIWARHRSVGRSLVHVYVDDHSKMFVKSSTSSPRRIDSWASIHRLSDAEVQTTARTREEAYGFPMLCAFRSTEWPSIVGHPDGLGLTLRNPNGQCRDNFNITTWKYAASLRESWSIPSRAHWGAAIINVGLIAIAVDIIRFLCVLALRWNRRRVGRCHDCGYITRGTPGVVCPECGSDLLSLGIAPSKARRNRR